MRLSSNAYEIGLPEHFDLIGHAVTSQDRLAHRHRFALAILGEETHAVEQIKDSSDFA
jgi:hypothetical protein